MRPGGGGGEIILQKTRVFFEPLTFGASESMLAVLLAALQRPLWQRSPPVVPLGDQIRD